MKRTKAIVMLLLAACLLAACNGDEGDGVDAGDFSSLGVNVLLIQSDNGHTGTGMMYKRGEIYNPPHCYLGKEIRYNDGQPQTIYHMSFGCNIKGSDVFDMLGIGFESNRQMSFSNLKKGDTFDSSEFHANAYYTPTWMEAILKGTTALSGKVTVLGTRQEGDMSYLSLRLQNLRFESIDHTYVYSVSGTIEYEIWD